jgi:hypothetical protein
MVAALPAAYSGHKDAADGLLYTGLGALGLGFAGTAALGVYDIATTASDLAAPRVQVGVVGADSSGRRATGAALSLRF